ncbi:MAG: hypothetical protein QNL62_13405 [Gammaproteobacteria bacterium]|nr:hypothetical protein [Gammaproteobacteria bacterium]
MGAIVVFEGKNQIARARNAGAKKASGDYLIFKYGVNSLLLPANFLPFCV